MRKIVKREPLPILSDYVRKHKPTRWEDVPFEIRANVREYILNSEQSGFSAYTERKLDGADESLHVDHFLKQQLCTVRERFEWTNLFVDEHAGSEQYGADYKDNSKHSPVKSLKDNQKLINPSLEDPHDYFEYVANGDIVPKSGLNQFQKERADFTIKAFNLNGSLANQRRDVLRMIAAYKLGNFTAEDTKTTLSLSCSFPSLIEYFCHSEIWNCIDANLALMR